jgi:inhibitor of cysteine peptidase
MNEFRKDSRMFRRIFSIIAFTLAIVPMAGCNSSQTKLTVLNNGKTVNVKSGELIVVELEGNPSTGYTWEAKDLDASVLQQVGEIAFKSNNPGLVGAGGTLTLTYKALKTGTTDLQLVYHRPWETDVEPLSTYGVKINIK